MTRTLLRNHFRAMANRLAALELGERARLVLLLVGLSLLVVFQLVQLSLPLAEQSGAALFDAARAYAYRLGVFLAAVVGLRSFDALWRADDREVLHRLPVPPGALYRYRLIRILLSNLPFLAAGITLFLPFALSSSPRAGLEALLFLGFLFLATALLSLRWHLFAGQTVASPHYAWVKSHLRGAMVMPERTVLLYSPMLGAASGFGLGLVFFSGLAALGRGQTGLGVGLLVASVTVLLYQLVRTEQAFEQAYYASAAALSEEEVRGELDEAAPSDQFLGGFFVVRLPPSLQPLVARDLRQAWRRNRLDHFMILGLSLGLGVLGLTRGPTGLPAAWWWPACVGVVGLSAWQAFRLNLLEVDAPWHWLSLPIPFQRQYTGRWLATAFFPLLASPGLLLALTQSGTGLVWSLGQLLVVMVSTTTLAVNLSLRLQRQKALAGIIFGTVFLVYLGSGAASQGWGTVGLLGVGVASLALLWGLPQRLASLEVIR